MAQITPAQFRENFPAFVSTDEISFPDTLIQFWLTIAYLMTNSTRWGALADLGAQLFAAHNIVLEVRALANVSVDGLPGESRGVISAEGADKASVAYDTASAVEKDAGHWNLTEYGLRWKRLSEMFGMGPMTVIGCGSADLLGSNAWAGPPPWPGWFA